MQSQTQQEKQTQIIGYLKNNNKKGLQELQNIYTKGDSKNEYLLELGLIQFLNGNFKECKDIIEKSKKQLTETNINSGYNKLNIIQLLVQDKEYKSAIQYFDPQIFYKVQEQYEELFQAYEKYNRIEKRKKQKLNIPFENSPKTDEHLETLLHFILRLKNCYLNIREDSKKKNFQKQIDRFFDSPEEKEKLKSQQFQTIIKQFLSFEEQANYIINTCENLDQEGEKFLYSNELKEISLETQFQRCLLRSKQKKFKEAKKIIFDLEARIPKEVNEDLSLFRINFRQGIIACDLKEWQLGYQSFYKSFNLYNEEGLSVYNKGVCLDNLRQEDEALKQYIIAMEIMPNHIDSRINYSLILQEQIYYLQRDIREKHVMIELLQNPSQLEKEEFENEIKFFQKRIKDKNKEITNTLLRASEIEFKTIEEMSRDNFLSRSVINDIVKRLQITHNKRHSIKRLQHQLILLNESQYRQKHFRKDIIKEIGEFLLEKGQAKTIDLSAQQNSDSIFSEEEVIDEEILEYEPNGQGILLDEDLIEMENNTEEDNSADWQDQDFDDIDDDDDDDDDDEEEEM